MTSGDETKDLDQKFEVISINDSNEEDNSLEPVVPHERQIVDDVIAIWKTDPETEELSAGKLHGIVKKRHPNWSVSEKRVKTLLKKFGLLNTDQQITYANDITSEETPDIDLPANLRIIMSAKRGKGLYAKKPIKKGELLWEEPQLFFVPPLENAELIKLGKACSYCGKLLAQSNKVAGASVLRGLDCNVCPEIWCSQKCKKIDNQLHGLLKHNVYNPHASRKNKAINSEAYLDLQNYCIKEQWNALFALAIIYANIVTDKTGVKGKQFRAMARVSQAVRYKALNSSAGAFDSLQGGALFVQEQQESLWQEGYKKFLAVFPQAYEEGKITYDEFLHLMGTYNINNLDYSIYLIQSHLNHNCSPNTSVETSTISRADTLAVYAARDIRAGEELTTTYVNPAHTVQQRQRELRVNWGFVCGCQKCKDDKKDQNKRKSSSASNKDKNDIRKMLAETKDSLDGDSIELDVPEEHHGERRKSVRFDEKVQVSTSN